MSIIAIRTPTDTPCPQWCVRPADHEPGEHWGREAEVVVCAGGLYDTGRDLLDSHIAVKPWMPPRTGKGMVAMRYVDDYSWPELTADEAEELGRLLLRTATTVRGRRPGLLRGLLGRVKPKKASHQVVRAFRSA